MITPGYGMFTQLPGARVVDTLAVPFAGAMEEVEVFELGPDSAAVRQIALESPKFSPLGPKQVYCDVPGEGPYATDATKFALFGAAVATWVRDQATAPDVVHLHDWHAAFYCLLRSFAPDYEALSEIRTVFTIHNLAYQGTRPLDGHASSLAAWFPGLPYDFTLVRDPAHWDCINPMALAIRTADRVSTVSPSYAWEILRPSDPQHGFVGGEGLEVQLANAARAGRLVGILNGCEYGPPTGRRPGWQRMLSIALEQATQWQKKDPKNPLHALAKERIEALPQRRPADVLVSIGRLVRQKVLLFLEELDDGRTALEHIVDDLGSNGVFFLLGSGEPALEARVAAIARKLDRLVFLRGYSETLADPLYRGGDLFLMPSSFEPCGISQMLAMRAAQPVVAHAVGGLCDTIEDNHTGFLFGGPTPREQAQNFVATVRRATEIKAADNERWQNLCIRAASRRFDWESAARATSEKLYEPEY